MDDLAGIVYLPRVYNAVDDLAGMFYLALVVGTRTGEIYEMDTTSYSYTLLLQGHGYGTVWGLATHPGQGLALVHFLSSSDG